MQASRRKWLIRSVVFVMVAIVLWLLASLTGVYWLTRRPHAIFAEPAPNVPWGRAESCRITTRDGEDLGAWFFAGQCDQPAVLLLHGNRGCRRDCLPQAKILATTGRSALLVSLRAHGDSTGNVNDFGYSAQNDVVAAVSWLREKQPGASVVVWGRSLGAAAAIFAAPHVGDDVAGYILECPYQDLHTAAQNRMEYYLPPIASHVGYAGASIVGPLVLPDADRISPLHAAASMPESAHVLIMAGGADRKARPSEARAIFERMPSHARLFIVPGGDHSNLPNADPTAYQGEALKLIGECRCAVQPTKVRSVPLER